MQTQGGAAAEAAIVSGERRFHVRLLADWNDNGLYNHALSDLSGYVKSASTDRSLKGGLPSEITLVEGSGAAQLDVELSGEYNGLPFSAVFSPYQTLSPFWNSTPVGTEIKYEIGVETSAGMVWYPQFVGNIRTVTPDRATGYVSITALDRVEMLRRPVMFPAWAMYEYQTSRGVIESLLTDTQWVIDHCLRKCNVSPTPLRPTSREENGLSDSDRTGPQIWINGTGGWLPTIGWCDNWNVVEFPDTESTGLPMYMTSGAVHPSSPEPTTKPLAFHALQTAGNDTLKYWCTNRDQMTPQGIQVLGFTLITSGVNGTYYQTASDFTVCSVRIGSTYRIDVWIGAGQIWTTHVDETLAITKTSSKVNIPTGGDFVQCNIVWDAFHASGPLVYVAAGANTNNAGAYEDLGAAYTYVSRNDELKGLFSLFRQVALNDIRYSSTNFGSLTVASALNWGYRAASYVAVLDRGINGISYIPQRQADDAWDVIAEVASAEFGAVFWDEAGVFRFWNNARLGSLKNTIVRDMSLDDVTGLRITNSLDSVRNIWSLDAGKRIAPQGVTFEASSVDEFYVPGGTEKYFRIWEDSVLSPNPGKLTRYSTIPASAFPQWDDDVIQGYVAQWWNGSDWVEDDGKVSGVDIYCYFDNEGRLVVKIWNGYGEEMRLATNDDQPAMRVEGTAIHTKDSQVTVYKDLVSINKWMGRNLRLSGQWYQEYSNYKNMIGTLIQSTKEPTPATEQITIAGDPRLQFGDTLRINDKYGFGESFNIQIYGIRRSFDVDSGLTDSLSVELIAPGGIWDSAIYGIWEQTFVWGP